MAINESLVGQYNVAKATLAAAQEAFDKVENALCQEMLVTETKTDLVNVNDTTWQVTVVAGETTKIDEKGLKTLMGAVKFRKICKPAKVDSKLLELAVKNGALSVETVSKYVSYSPNKPFLRVTKVADDARS